MRVLNLPPEEIPTAHQVAVAVIAAAKVLGEDPLLIGVEMSMCRSRWPALAALKVFYSEVPTTRLGSYVGASTSPKARLQSAQRNGWWSELGVAAFDAAMTALENA